MASSPSSKSSFDSGLEIKTRSVEQTLVPLVSQITTLINHKDKLKKSEKTPRALRKLGQAVGAAVGRFVTVGEAIATENQELQEEMNQACSEARRAGETIARLTDVGTAERLVLDGEGSVFTDRTGMVKAARMLLSSVTKVLVLADRVVIKQIIASRNKVLITLERLEKVISFQEFVQIFSQFGNEMVEFAHLTGDRQNDLKDEKKKAKMAVARAVLEKCTMMLLTASKKEKIALIDEENKAPTADLPILVFSGECQSSCAVLSCEHSSSCVMGGSLYISSMLLTVVGDPANLLACAILEELDYLCNLIGLQTCLRHPDCESARINKDAVFQRMLSALELVIQIVTDTWPYTDAEVLPISIYSGIRDFKGKVQQLREDLHGLTMESLTAPLERVIEQTEDFTDSAYTSHEHRESILQLCHRAKEELGHLGAHWTYAQSLKVDEATEEMEISILKTCHCASELRQELHKAAVRPAVDLLKYHTEHTVVKALKACGGEGNLESVDEYSGRLTEQKEQLVETFRLLRHVSGTEPLEITCVHAEETFQVIGPQIISAAQTLALHPSSKIARENLEVFCEAWESQLGDMSVLLREINDVFEGRSGDKKAGVSLPRPGKHLPNHKLVKAVKLDAEEQSTIAKLGLELRLVTSDLDSESEKWDDPEQEIVHQAQSMSSMAYSMYLFTRGEGLLKTTLDLFHQAEVFSEEGFQLCSSIRGHSSQVGDEEKAMITSETEKLASLCQHLQVTTKTMVQGKSATFLKVQSSIEKTKGILEIVVFLLPVCHKLIKKCASGSSSLCSPQLWREDPLPSPDKEDSFNNKNSSEFGVKSLENHMASLTFLESK